MQEYGIYSEYGQRFLPVKDPPTEMKDHNRLCIDVSLDTRLNQIEKKTLITKKTQFPGLPLKEDIDIITHGLETVFVDPIDTVVVT